MSGPVLFGFRKISMTRRFNFKLSFFEASVEKIGAAVQDKLVQGIMLAKTVLLQIIMLLQV